MGLFDFFKKKGNIESNAPDNKKKGADNIRTNQDSIDSKKITYSDLTNQDDITYYNGGKFSGVAFGIGIGLATVPKFNNATGSFMQLPTKIPGHSKKEYKDGVLIKTMQYFSDGSLESMSNSENGYEERGWEKVNEDGQYDENGKRILIFEKKDGRHIVYYNNGNKKSEKYGRRQLDAIPNPDEDKTYTEISYYENGNLKEKEVTTSYDSTGNNGGEQVEYKSFYPSSQLSEERVQDKVLADKNIRYYENGFIKRIYASYTKSLYNSSGLYFEFDDKGNETTERVEKELELDSSLRKDLNLDEFKGTIKKEEVKEERELLSHEIMTKGSFSFTDKDGKDVTVFGQRHALISKTQTWYDDTEQWEDLENCIEELFYLTDYEKGYRFSVEDLQKFFEIDDWPEWDYNGHSNDWCGIEEEDDSGERQKKWDNYKSKFTEVDSVDQFNIEN
tara:strand:+ start:44 stop:1384 length:1341 start_codon:yes stop_codon:yes gene_type:complete